MTPGTQLLLTSISLHIFPLLLLLLMFYYLFLFPQKKHCVWKGNSYLLLPLLGALTSSILLHSKYNGISSMLSIALIALLVAILQSVKNNKQLVVISLSLIFFFAGILLMQLHHKKYGLIAQSLEKPSDIVATVASISPSSGGRWNQIIDLTINTIKHQGKTLAPNNSAGLRCYIIKPTPLQIGNKICMKNITLPPAKKGKTLCGNPTFHDYLLKEGIVGTLFLKTLRFALLETKRISFFCWLERKRLELYASLARKINAITFQLFAQMFLGKKMHGASSGPQKEQFCFWGISHFLARSGLHVVIFILLWSTLFRAVPLPFAMKQIFLLFLCSLYGILTWPSTSFYRALFIFLAYEGGRLLGKQVLFLHILTITCFLFLLWHPLSALFLDFQLSFGLTFALSLSHLRQTKP